MEHGNDHEEAEYAEQLRTVREEEGLDEEGYDTVYGHYQPDCAERQAQSSSRKGASCSSFDRFAADSC